MPNTPFDRRHPQSLRPPRYDRLAEQAAFHLGYTPYQLWYDFTELEHDEPDAVCRRWLEDLPILLAKWLTPYTIDRYAATLKEVLGLFADYQASISEAPGCVTPVEIEDPEVVEVRLRGELDRACGRSENQPADQPNDVDSQDTASSNIENDLDPQRLGSEIRSEDEHNSNQAWAVSSRMDYLFRQRLFGTEDAAGHSLIRLASAIGKNLPPQLQRWFRLGQTVGRCLSYLTKSYSGSDVDIRQEILIAASGTDFQDDDVVPDISRSAYETSDAKDIAPTCRGYFDWAYRILEQLVADADAYLVDEPVIVLDRVHRFLWFLGTYVTLTQSECAVLTVIAECKDDVVRRYVILRDALKNSTVSEDDQGDVLRKADQYIMQILDKIVAAIKADDSPFFQDNERVTRGWLRQQFLPAVPGIGWCRGPLFHKMVVK
jgi:hypothetical protein